MGTTPELQTCKEILPIGQGVTRFFLSSCIEKLKSGFSINFGLSRPGHQRNNKASRRRIHTIGEKDAASVQELAYAWDLPSITETNRRWILRSYYPCWYRPCHKTNKTAQARYFFSESLGPVRTTKTQIIQSLRYAALQAIFDSSLLMLHQPN
ncbi:unnamed protein product [Gadus morhua 'NCC']